MTITVVENGVRRPATAPEIAQREADALASEARQKDVLKAEALEYAEMIGRQFTAGYPASERQSWPVKQAEAKMIVAGETDPARYPVIAAEISITGETAPEVAGLILAKAAIFERAAGLLSGFRQSALAAIDAAEDAQAARTALDSAKAELSAALA